MKVSREQVADNRRRVLEAASRLFRERGFEAVTVAEVMQAAGLTHGGFYRHFKSKEDLSAQALEHTLELKAKQPQPELARFMASYLSPAHRDAVAEGCPIAALAGEAARATPEVRTALSAGVQQQIEVLAGQLSGSKARRRRSAIAAWSAMVGALVLARLSDDEAASDEILKQTEAYLRDQLARQSG